jgi:hypothetical protein
MLEAALEGTPPAARTALYQRLQAAEKQAFASVFPNYGPWGKPKNPKLPPTPLANEERLNLIRDPASRFHVYDKIDDPVEIQSSGPLPLEGRAGEGVEAGTRSANSSEAPLPAAPPLPGAAHELPRVRWGDFGSPVLPLLPPRRGEGTGRTKRRRRDHASNLTRNRRPARPVKPRRPNVSRGNHRFLSPKTRFATKLNLAHLNAATAAPVSRDAAAVIDPEAQTRSERDSTLQPLSI